ncbi:MAG: YifB family Mg chelatase-like AAA ATPase [Hahellaceae bacterium]|nr:YifB family Mg chelatase-like AAA ATPase [Hahellaceae bacterium]MCP5168406.1 YifB family Mg chelatase-like AAA ATPase [Hahellaceae bacterium]
MSLSKVYSRAQVGISAPQVIVETHISNGLPQLAIVGLPETAVKESKDRVRSALLNAGFEFPAKRITINLAPADLPKEGGRYDLAIALGILSATGQVPLEALANKEFLGELALTGELRAVRGALPAAIAAGNDGRSLYVAEGNRLEASLSMETAVYAANHLLDVCADLCGEKALEVTCVPAPPAFVGKGADLLDVKGQYQARRALEIAAAGGHNLLLYGPPGTGKSMLASRLPGILPPLSEQEALEVAAVYSIAGKLFDHAQWGIRPFRGPHHTASAAALVGGGSQPRPGEVTLAHHGVLFLDELPEFNRKVLEVLREPIESGHIVISRANNQTTFPARFQLVAALNPCPCGYLGHPAISCSDTPQQVAKYRQKLSGPMLDRFDLHVEVPAQAGDVLTRKDVVSESSAQVKERVMAARQRQMARQGMRNQDLSGAQLEESCALDSQSRLLLESALNRLGLSARALHRVMRVARTIADLEARQDITTRHLTEALGYRKLDRKVGS